VDTFAESDLVFTEETGRRAMRYFLLRRYRSFVWPVTVLATITLISYLYVGKVSPTDVLGIVLALNLVFPAIAFYSMPRSLGRIIGKLRSPLAHVTLTEDKLTLSFGGDISTIPWSRIRHIWLQEDFAVLHLSLLLMVHLPTEGMSADVRKELQRRATALGA
jgi:hypothetical protein